MILRFAVLTILSKSIVPQNVVDMMHQATHELSCFQPDATDFYKAAQKPPLYPTNPDSFLFPILKWGPTNQIQGLFESVKLAINTNRTLVLPPMFLHFNDKQSTYSKRQWRGRVIDPSVRINTNGLLSFVRTVPPETYYEKCGKFADINILPSADAIFGPNTRSWQELTGIKIVNDKKEASTPISHDLQAHGRCAILSRPYKEIPLVIKSELTLDVVDLPSYIYKLLDDFVSGVIRNDGFSYNRQREFNNIDWAIHWRFSVGDWSRRCDESQLDQRIKRQQDECRMLKLITVDNVAQVLHAYIKSKGSRRPEKKVRIFIASPPGEFEFLDKVRHVMDSYNPGNYKTYLSRDFESYLDGRYAGSNNCSFYSGAKGEVLSLADQSVAVNAAHFIKWPGSSWSGRVQILRQMKHHKLEPVTIVSLLEERLGQEVPAEMVRSSDGVYQKLVNKVDYVFQRKMNYFKNLGQSVLRMFE